MSNENLERAAAMAASTANLTAYAASRLKTSVLDLEADLTDLRGAAATLHQLAMKPSATGGSDSELDDALAYLAGNIVSYSDSLWHTFEDLLAAQSEQQP